MNGILSCSVLFHALKKMASLIAKSQPSHGQESLADRCRFSDAWPLAQTSH